MAAFSFHTQKQSQPVVVEVRIIPTLSGRSAQRYKEAPGSWQCFDSHLGNLLHSYLHTGKTLHCMPMIRVLFCMCVKLEWLVTQQFSKICH